MTKSLKIGLIILLVLVIGGLATWAKMYKYAQKNTESSIVQMQDLEGATSLELEGERSLNLELSKLNWEGSKTLIPGYVIEGEVGLASGGVTLAGGTVTGGQIEIDMTSIETIKAVKEGSASKIAEHLKGEDFFDVENFPTAKIAITSATPQGAEFMYDVKADLTIKEVTKPISFEAQIFEDNGVARAVARVEIDRTEWGIQYGSGKFFKELGDNVINDMMALEFNLVTE